MARSSSTETLDAWIVLDTTVLWDTKMNPNDPNLHLVLAAREKLGHKIAVPEVALREHINQDAAGLRKLWNLADEHLRKYGSIFGKAPAKLDARQLPRDLRRREKELRKTANRLFDAILPVPAVTLDQVLARDLARKRPFDEKGRGFRDYLIWESILKLRKPMGHRVMFVSGNHTDFAAGGNLHPDLVADLEARGHKPNSVLHFANLKEIIDQFIKGSFDLVDDQEGKPLGEVYGKKVENAALAKLYRRLAEFKKPEDLFDLMPGAKNEDRFPWDATLHGTVSAHFGKIASVVQLPNGEKFIEVEAGFDLLLTYAEEWTHKGPLLEDIEAEMTGIVRLLWDETNKELLGLRLGHVRFKDFSDVSDQGQWMLEKEDADYDYEGPNEAEQEPLEPDAEPPERDSPQA